MNDLIDYGSMQCWTNVILLANVIYTKEKLLVVMFFLMISLEYNLKNAQLAWYATVDTYQYKCHK